MSQDKHLQYKIAGPATWELIRAAYLAGESAPALAERFHVSIHAIRRRATIEKWTKRAYAAALEARGLPPPPKRPPVNVAERFAQNYAPPSAPPEPEHPFAELVAALKEASAAAEGVRTRALDAASAQPAAEQAADLERRALAQAGVALERGKPGDAKALAAVAEHMRKRVAEDESKAAAIVEAEAQAEAAEKRSKEEELVGKFCYAAFLAYCMVHNPDGAPAIFVDAIAGVRRDAFGEGDEESIAKARETAESARRYFGLDEDRWQAAFARGGLADAEEARENAGTDDPTASGTATC